MQPRPAGTSGTLRRWGAGGGRYARSLLWLIRRGLSAAPLRVVLIVLANAFGVLTAASSYGLLLQYARCMQSGEALVIRGLTLAQGGQWQGALLVAGVTAALGLSSAGAIFAAQALILSIARTFETRCRGILLEALGEQPARRWSTILGDPRVPPVVVRMMNVGARFCAFSLRFVLQGVLPLLTLLAALAFMLWQAPLLTVLLVPFALAYLPALFLINRAIARRYQLYQGHYGVAAMQIRQQVGAVLHSNAPSADEEFSRAKLLEGEAYATGQRGFYRHMLFGEALQLVNSGFFILCMIFLFLCFASPWKVVGGSWAELIAVLIALRFVWKGVRQTTAVLGGISRYHPELHRFVGFVDAGSRQDKSPGKSGDVKLPTRVVPPTPTDLPNCQTVAIEPGGPIGVVLDGQPRRDTAAEVVEALTSQPVAVGRCAVHLGSTYRPWLTPEQNALGPAADANEARSELARLLEDLGVSAELGARAGEPLTEPVSPEAKCALLWAHCFLGDAAWVLVSAEEFARLAPAFRETLLARWRADGKTVFLLTGRTDALLDGGLAPSLAGVAVIAGGRLVGCGPADWLAENRALVDERTAGPHRQPPTRREENDLLELEMI